MPIDSPTDSLTITEEALTDAPEEVTEEVIEVIPEEHPADGMAEPMADPSVLARKIEAILYLKAQPLTLANLVEYAGCDRETVKEALMDLLGDYAHRNTALEIVETDKGYSLQLKETYLELVKNLVPVDLGVGAMRTLATIAIRGPISQTELIDYRGSGAYDHVKDLVERGFVAKRRQANGRSFSLQVTEQFYQYFQLEGVPDLRLTAKAQRRRQELADAVVATPPETEQLDLPEPLPETLPEPDANSPENSPEISPDAILPDLLTET